MTLDEFYKKSPSTQKADQYIANSGFAERAWILTLLPKHSIGAEIGVFTGMFSEQILRIVEPIQLSLVDVWSIGGVSYGDWGDYTDFGNLKTSDAKEAVRIRTQAYQTGNVDIVETDGVEWLHQLEDGSLDWVYLDTTHQYEQTLTELNAAVPKLKPDGIIIGDDWYPEADHIHAGVMLAVNDFIRSSNYDLRLAGRANQWMVKPRPSILAI